MSEYKRLDGGNGAGEAKLEKVKSYRLEPGHAGVYDVGAIHAIDYPEGSRFVRVTGRDLDYVQRLKFDTAAGKAITIESATARPRLGVGLSRERSCRALPFGPGRAVSVHGCRRETTSGAARSMSTAGCAPKLPNMLASPSAASARFCAAASPRSALITASSSSCPIYSTGFGEPVAHRPVRGPAPQRRSFGQRRPRKVAPQSRPSRRRARLVLHQGNDDLTRAILTRRPMARCAWSGRCAATGRGHGTRPPLAEARSPQVGIDRSTTGSTSNGQASAKACAATRARSTSFPSQIAPTRPISAENSRRPASSHR